MFECRHVFSIFIISTTFLCQNFTQAVWAQEFAVPGALQQKILLKLRDEMIRLDGEGLIARRDRPEDFTATTDRIAQQSAGNRTALDFYHSFKQLDATYPNLHARVEFSDRIENEVEVPLYKDQSLWLMTETDGVGPARVVLDQVKGAELQGMVTPGDEVLAINGRSVPEWLTENFLFCKYPLRAQCDRSFEEQLLTYSLSWKGGPLVYSIRHGEAIREIPVAFTQPTPSPVSPLTRRRCDYRHESRFPGFRLAHRGLFACVFEKVDDPAVAILRISSFQYKRQMIPNDEPIKSLSLEVESLWQHWQQSAARYSVLVIDLLDNHGGQSPTPYYQLLMRRPFQEQYVRFRKTPEMENPVLRQSLFWNSPALELWFQKILGNGSWNTLPPGGFSSPAPMFCSDDTRPCDETQFTPRNHPFRGEIKVLVNEGCVSSCDGFTWMMKRQLNAKLYGFHQAADSAFSRLRADVVLDPAAADGFRVLIQSIQSSFPAGFLVGQTIAASLSTDSTGEVLSGRPLPLDALVPYRFGVPYARTVLAEALRR